ncbi:MAG TPA: ATP-binding protein [Dongiaceae bacterium]|nr:ATP-binding protein [Dongiaceae bacterium]
MSKLRQLNVPLGWAALYAATGFLVGSFQQGEGPYVWYPPIAIGIACLHRAGLRFWPLLLLADLAVSLYQDDGRAAAALVIAASNLTAIAGVAFALRRIRKDFEIADHRDLAWLALAGAGASVAAAGLGSILLPALTGTVEMSTWGARFGWWLGDAVSAISLTPLILILTARRTEPGLALAMPSWEQGCILGAAIAVSYASFGEAPLVPGVSREALAPLIFAPVVWAALRLGVRATAIVILVTAVATVLSLWSSGDLAEAPAYHEVLEVQVFLVALPVIGLSLSLALDRERRSRIEAESREAQLQQAAEDVRAASTRLALAAKAANVGVWDWNLEDNSLVWDDQVYAMYQIDRETTIDKYLAWLQRVHPDDSTRLLAEINGAIARGEDVRSNFRVILPDGNERYFNTHGIVQTSAGGKATRIIGIDYDVTELVRQRLKAEQSELRAAAANRAKSEFLAIMSHELRTPLNAIIGFSDLMAREAFGPLQNPRYTDYVADISSSGHLLLSLINDILDLTRIEAGKLDLNLEAIGPAEIMGDIVRLLAPLAHAKSLDLSARDAAGCKPLLADRRALRQLLNNLTANSIKFTDSGGAVTLSAETVDAGRVALLVADNGRGIPRERIPDLCKPFVQIADPLRRDVGGIGLGLAISRSLAEALGGTLEIDSDLGKGTTVRVTLPAA